MKIVHMLWLGLAAAGLAGCSSPRVNYYRLDGLSSPAPAAPVATPVARPRVQIGPVTVPPWLDRPQIVLDAGSGRVEVLEASRWAAPLPRMIAAAVARSAAATLGDTAVEAWPVASAVAADWVVRLDLRALQARPGLGVHLDAVWRIEREGVVVASGRCVQDVAAGRDLDSLVAAHNAALDALAAQVAAGLAGALS